MSKISPLAYIHPEAVIGENVEIGPFVYIDRNVVIGDNNIIMPNANILYGARIGNGNTIFPGHFYFPPCFIPPHSIIFMRNLMGNSTQIRLRVYF